MADLDLSSIAGETTGASGLDHSALDNLDNSNNLNNSALDEDADEDMLTAAEVSVNVFVAQGAVRSCGNERNL